MSREQEIISDSHQNTLKHMDEMLPNYLALSSMSNSKMRRFVERYYIDHEPECQKMFYSAGTMDWIKMLAQGLDNVLLLRRAVAVMHTASNEEIVSACKKAYPRFETYLLKHPTDIEVFDTGLAIPHYPVVPAIGAIGTAIIVSRSMGIDLFENAVDADTTLTCLGIAGSTDGVFSVKEEIGNDARKMTHALLEQSPLMEEWPAAGDAREFAQDMGGNCISYFATMGERVSEKDLLPVMQGVYEQYIKKDIEKAVDKFLEENSDTLTLNSSENIMKSIETSVFGRSDIGLDDNNSINSAENIDKILKDIGTERTDFWTSMLVLGLKIKRMGDAYNNAINEGIRLYDEQQKKDSSVVDAADFNRAVRERDETKRDSARKQNTINELQIKLDKLNQKLAEEKKKSKELSKQQDELMKAIESGMFSQPAEELPANAEDAHFPEKTVLFGGHPNWVRKFALKYPDVKIINVDDKAFSIDALRNAELVLINTSHMSHSQFARVIAEVRKHKLNIRYVKG